MQKKSKSHNTIELSGQKFGKLFVIGRDYRPDRRTGAYWNCVCDCGNKVSVRSHALRNITRSCGCIRMEVLSNKRESRTGLNEYGIWRTMISRCYTRSVNHYKNYGGKGITVCDSWLKSFDNFIDDMGLRPSNRHTIERKDNNCGYSPDNCVWATYSDQAKNRSNNRYIEFNGERLILSDWARRIGISSSSMSKRIKNWGEEKAITTPKPKNRKLREEYRQANK